MDVEQSNIDHIMRGLQSTEGVRLHNHRKKLRQRFDIIKKLGQGTYGKVQLGINKETGQEVAIKAIKKCKIETEADLVRIRREIQIMSSVRHPNIIHIYEVFENREKMVLVMEYAAGGELYDFLSERVVLEETEARRIFRQISIAVYYCHKHKICHRDLKLENILLDENGNAKIADFGLSNVYDQQGLLNSFCGSPLYASPEIVKGTPYHGPEVDCWSLGVLLYTLVYGEMPFDGSNFKRLVKQISQGVYFEPKIPSPASPLIRDMLTVNPQKRATIEQICSHWWVDQGFNVSCLEIAEDLANLTPVRLDLLLSLAPPPKNAEKLVVTDDQSATSKDAPARSLSVGSFMELDPNTEQRIREFVAHEVHSDSNEKTVKRKLESDASESSIKKEGVRKKERIKQNGEQLKESEEITNKDDTGSGVMEVDLKTSKASVKEEEEKPTEASAKTEEVKPQDEVPKVPKEIKTEESKPEGAIAKDKPTRKSVKIVKKKVVKEGENEKEESEGADSKIKVKKKKKEDGEAEAKTEEIKPEGAIAKDKPTRKSVQIVKKKVVKEGEKEKEESEGADSKIKVKKKKTEEGEAEAKKEEIKPEEKQDAKEKDETGKEIKRDSATRKSQGSVKTPTKTSEEAPAPKLAERRKSKIFETAEKFMTNDPKSPSPEKPKKVFIPGVKVSDFAKAFERKSSLTSTPSVKASPSRKSISKESDRKSEERTKESPEKKPEAENSSQKTEEVKPKQEEEEHKPTEITDEKLKKLKDSARNIISNALVEEERKKIKKQILKPPVPKTKPEDSDGKKPLTLQIGKETATVQVHSPENTKFLFDAPTETPGENKENIEGSNEKKTSKMEITLRSNTLPRGGKTELRLKSLPPLEKTENFRTEVEQRVGDPHSRFTTQRSEVAFPVSAPQRPTRSMSLEPEVRKTQTKERIIPIQLEGREHKEESEARDRIKDLERPKMQYQRTLSQRSTSLSRQSTQDSDTDATPTAPGEAIKKSPREFIIPIAVEGGGYVTSDTLASKRGIRPSTRKIILFSDDGSEDESPFSTLPRHTDLDEPFRLHTLRSTRSLKSSFDKADSGSGSEEEDDDAFEILTAENLFSTLLSRVRSLTQRLNVDSGIRPGFPSSRLMNHFSSSERLFSNIHHPMQTRLSERPGFGRSLSRDIENGFGRRGRSDLTNSDSARTLPREKSKRSESDTESISESSYGSTRRKTKTSDEKKLKRISRTKSTLSTPSEENRIRQDENSKSLIPRRSYQRQVSDSELMEPMHPTLHRTLSVKSSKGSERKSIGLTDQSVDSGEKVKDFYDILAEKYGIRNVKRYDLPEEKPKKKPEEVPAETAPDEKKPEELPPIPPKTKKEEPEKCKAPSEKLAAVLNRLESGNKTKKKPQQKEEFKPVDKERLAALSPQALELYEKTLALYHKKKEDETKTKLLEKRETPEKSVLSKYLPGMEGEKVDDDFFNEKKLKHYGSLKSRLTEEKNRKAENKEAPVRRKSLKEGDAEKKEERIKRLSKDLEAELNKEVEEEQKKKNKILTSLEKKFEKFRNERKYVDKAIRSLRESSVGPKDVSSENVLIKRAVSVSDCSPKGVQSNRVQSTVNSVLGIFKKIESSKENVEESKIPVARGKPALEIDLPNKNKTEAPRRASYAAGSYTSRNDLSLHKSPSSLLGWDDSSSLRSPDSESFDSWSNCSDLGSPDDLNYRAMMRHSKTNFDEMSTESVGDRIRRKSFYTRFNERKKPRRSSLLESRRKYDEESKSEVPSKSYDEQRSRQFYKNEPEKTIYRKTSFDWPKTIPTPAFSRVNSQSSTFSGYPTLSRSYVDSFKESRFSRIADSLYKTGNSELERALSPVRPFSPNRALSPNHCRSPSQNSLD